MTDRDPPPLYTDAAIARLESEKRAAPLVWRPIETAPKDGTEVDLWCFNQSALSSAGRVADCHYHCGEWLKYGDNAEVGWIVIYNATHWMPLPEPPNYAMSERAAPHTPDGLPELPEPA